MLRDFFDLYRRLNRWLGEKLFCNNSGLTGNLAGSVKYKVARLAYPGDARYGGGVERLSYRYDEEMIDEFREKALEFLKDPENGREMKIDGETVKRTLNSTEFDFGSRLPDIGNFFPETVREELESILGSRFRVYETTLIHTSYTRAENIPEGSTFNYHADWFSSDAFRYFVLLDRVSDQDGPTEVVSREKTKKVKRSDRCAKDLEADLKLTGEKGEGLLLDITGHLHRGSIPDEAHERVILMFTIFPSIRGMDDDWFEDIRCNFKDPARYRGLKSLTMY